MDRKIFVVGGSQHYAVWMQGRLVNSLEAADLVVFTGGEDVSPFIYNRLPNPTTCNNPERDLYEMHFFEQAKALGKKMIGICRGSQLLCALNGGILVQNQNNPSFLHPIKTFDNQQIVISSTHHQAAFPFVLPNDEYKILGWTENMLKFHEGETHKEELNPPKECEIVFYPKTQSLGIQGHPEMITEIRPTIAYVRSLLNRFMSGQL